MKYSPYPASVITPRAASSSSCARTPGRATFIAACTAASTTACTFWYSSGASPMTAMRVISELKPSRAPPMSMTTTSPVLSTVSPVWWCGIAPLLPVPMIVKIGLAPSSENFSRATSATSSSVIPGRIAAQADCIAVSAIFALALKAVYSSGILRARNAPIVDSQNCRLAFIKRS